MKTSVHIFIQCLLCLILAVSCLVLKYRQSTAVSQTGTFGFTKKPNDTFSHFAENLYDGVYYEHH